MGFGQFLFVLISGFVFLSTFASGVLPPLQADEVEALREIGKKLGKKWNFTVDPCSGNLGWVTPNAPDYSINSVTCGDCNTTVCHIVSIVLKSQSLPGVLPPELVKLPHLREISLPRNYLSGTIPPEWASLKLVNISLQANRLSGPIPKEFGKMTTLKKLTIEYNQFSFLPPELGDLINLDQIMISSNNFTGELPKEFARLTNLTDFRISDNKFTGNIPNFIQNWRNLKRLEIQASGLEGPIPSSISLLEKLTDLRISDITGTNITFPSWNRSTNLRTLILRNCNISGEIPDYIGFWTSIKTLDLSFNKLTGEIPRSFERLTSVDFMYLTGNLLTGHVPDWLKKEDYIDLSYNNFTSGISSCNQSNLNLFGTSSLGQNMTGVVPCLKSNECPKLRGYFYINCGATDAYTTGNITYEADSEEGSPSKFFKKDYWAFSSTGHFLDNGDDTDTYLANNVSQLLMKDFQLYTRARISPLSLTYYGFCLRNGNYNVKLHFAEIIFTDDKTFNSLGRHIFDVYIQGELVLKDYNIVDDAGGAGKKIIKKFSVVVTSGTLEIRLYWAGKGTTAIPTKGIYGPLISAISVSSDY